MKNFIWILLCLFLSGCVSVEMGMEPQKIETGQVKKFLTNIDRVYVGMTKAEVIDVMGNRITIGYEHMGEGSKAEPIFLKSPYRTEILKDTETTYEVMYYFTRIKKADGIIADEELAPLVFEKNKLIGKGQDFLFKLKNTLN